MDQDQTRAGSGAQRWTKLIGSLRISGTV